MFFFCKSSYRRKEKSSLPVIYRIFESRKRTSLSASQKGSLTLEAACVLPFFCFGMLAICYFFIAVTAAGNVAEGLCEAGKKMAVYASQKEESDSVGEAENIFSLIYVRGEIEKKAGSYLSGLHVNHSSILEEEEMINLAAEYEIKIRVPFFLRKQLLFWQKASVRAWTGQKEKEGEENEDGEGTLVYVTVTGNVYHKDRECSHIRLSIQNVAKTQVAELRNKDGGKYYPCESCGGTGNHVYITETGNRYHSSLTCSGLKRGVIAIPMSQVSNWSACLRCGQ